MTWYTFDNSHFHIPVKKLRDLCVQPEVHVIGSIKTKYNEYAWKKIEKYTVTALPNITEAQECWINIDPNCVVGNIETISKTGYTPLILIHSHKSSTNPSVSDLELLKAVKTAYSDIFGGIYLIGTGKMTLFTTMR